MILCFLSTSHSLCKLIWCFLQLKKKKEKEKEKTTVLTTNNLVNLPSLVFVSFVCILLTAAFLPYSRDELLQQTPYSPQSENISCLPSAGY